jgi:membrane-associated phospholipid phosphatase
LGLIALFFLLLIFDVHLVRARLAVMDDPDGLVKQTLVSLRDFGQPLPIIVAMTIVAFYDTRRAKTVIVAMIVAQILAGLVYNGGKLTIVRYRPFAADEKIAPYDELTMQETWKGLAWGNRGSKHQSFPSGHSASGFVFGTILAFFYPRLRGLWFGLAAGCALSRFIDLMHWPSDCLMGGCIGYLGACAGVMLALRIAPLPPDANDRPSAPVGADEPAN